MSRYIDADKLYEMAITHKDFKQSIADLVSLKEVLDDTPPADVVEVVRCKNCKFWDDDERCNGIKNGLILEYTNGYDYCSYGERKENNDR